MDRETIQILLDLLNPLHAELDRQTYDDRVRENFDAPRDREYNVDVSAQMERDLCQAVMILKDRMHRAQLEAHDPRLRDSRVISAKRGL
jgi:hypothetical protein